MVSTSQSLVPETQRAARQVESLYKDLERGVNIIHAPGFKDLVCPKNWKDHAFDRWFKLKEGYSSFMIQQLLKEFKARPDDWVLDPFNGSGSTIVGAMKAGINGAGFEVNPFLASLAKTKVKIWDDSGDLERSVNTLMANVKTKPDVTIEPPALTITKKLFGEQLDDVLRVKQEITRFDDPDVRSFLLVGLGCVLE
nr:DNA methyltransferase [Candidatus Sigynarchaeota archaeon]